MSEHQSPPEADINTRKPVTPEPSGVYQANEQPGDSSTREPVLPKPSGTYRVDS